MEVVAATHLTFAKAINQYWRIFAIDNENKAYCFIVLEDTALELVEWLNSGVEGTKTLEGNGVSLLIAPNKDNRLSYQYTEDQPTAWRRKLAKPRAS